MFKGFHEIPLYTVATYWNDPTQPKPWHKAPVIMQPGKGLYLVNSMVVITAAGIAYNVDRYTEFYRLMVLKTGLAWVHENGRSEPVIQVFVSPEGVAETVPEPIKLLDSQDNVIPFKR